MSTFRKYRLWHMRCAIVHAHLYTRLKHERCAKKACLVWFKKLQGVQQITRLKQQRFLSFTFYITQRSYICIIFCYQLYYIFIFFTERTTDFERINKKHEWWNISFSDVFTYCLNLKNSASLFFLIQGNFMF